MLCTSELNMAETITPDDVDVLLDNAAWAICSIYHTVLKASPGVAIFGCNMLFDIPNKINYLINYHYCSMYMCDRRKSF